MRTISLAAVTLALGLGMSSTAAAQAVPGTLHFSGRLTATDGTPITGTRDVEVTLYDAATAGAAVWTEAHPDVTFADGVVYLVLGDTVPLDETTLDGRSLYLEIEIDATVMSPRLEVASVPYSVRASAAAVADSANTFGTLEPDDVVTSVTVGSGLSGGGMGNNVSIGLMSCLPDHYLFSNGSSWSCAPVPNGDITGITAGAGLIGGGSNGDIGLSVAFSLAGGDNGTEQVCARGDHLHDGRYFTEAELSLAGTINAGGNPVDWTRLKGVPVGLADGVDSDTQYTAGAGLALAGTVFSAQFTVAGGDAGTGTLIARGDHLHDGRYPIQNGRAGGQVLVGGTGAGEDLVLRSTTNPTRGEIYLGDDGSAVSIGGGLPSSTLDVNGQIRSNDVLKVGAAAPVVYERSHQRYIVEAPPSSVGVIVPLDTALVDQLCRDRDGCSIQMAMVNWDQPGQPGNVAHRTGHMFHSETSRWWRFNDGLGEPAGTDAASGVQEISAWDCYFGDAETYTGTPNGRADATTGWGLLNCAGCNYSDATVTCRVIIED